MGLGLGLGLGWQLLATASTDKTVCGVYLLLLQLESRAEWMYDGCDVGMQVKLWDTSGNAPSCLVTRDPKLVRTLLLCCIRSLQGAW